MSLSRQTYNMFDVDAYTFNCFQLDIQYIQRLLVEALDVI